MAATGPIGGYVETRTRSTWGKVWRVLLAAWTLGFAYQIARMIWVAGEAARDGGPLVAAFVGNVLSTRLIEAAGVWIVGAVPLMIASLLTRARRSWVPVGPVPTASPAPPAVRPPDRTGAEARTTRVVIGGLWLAVVLVVIAGLLLSS